MLSLLAVAFLIIACAFFVAAEFALVAVDRSRVDRAADQGGRRARMARNLLTHLSFHLSGAQLGITVTSLLIGILARPAIAHLLEPLLEPLVGSAAVAGVSLLLALAIATVVQMVIGELIPKSLAIANPEKTAFLLAPVIHVYGLIFGPIIRVLNGAANAAVRLLGVEPTEELSQVRTLAELQILVRSSLAEGTLDESATRLISRSIRFESKVAEDALIPRTSIVGLAKDESVTRLVELSVVTGHSRLIVHDGDLDHVLGIVHVQAVHRIPFAERASTAVSELMRPVLAVPESRGLDDLLVDLRRANSHMAVVVDEYGGTAGIITIEDVLEEIVGDIGDEHDPMQEPALRPGRTGEWILEGTLHPDEVMEQTELVIPEGEYETLAGFVLDRLGHIPFVGEAVELGGWRFIVMSMEKRRIAEVRVLAPIGDQRGGDAHRNDRDAGGSR